LQFIIVTGLFPLAHGPHPGHIRRPFYTPLPLAFFDEIVFTSGPPIRFRRGK
jgi:hypothetical protein